MEVKQEFNEFRCKDEIDNEGRDSLFDTFKIEINEEPKRESTNDTFEFLVLKEDPIKTEKVEYEDKLILCDEKGTNEKNKYKKPIIKLQDLVPGQRNKILSAKIILSRFGEAVLLELEANVTFLPQRVTTEYKPFVEYFEPGK
ncbi:unnamed protein product [Diabrotica balteata]|uniref:Uncharacterized protein n=1 Tax=Diabrotica balteata TaxID=107213 RepID=A0A9N9TG74_DIABA|nr:unnamed protein product [Diabrotica balteata]